ncbi:ion channel domain-containing protein [Ditylenchus destructor]|uniref:Ion channel domain-containing protein n=1 Tax=Ditylenchus destructor TaxID=166010 RepID=A0AAD4R7V5_9BILA|nr:ion channel domain-containing protein [Ditylenchus destructor]
MNYRCGPRIIWFILIISCVSHAVEVSQTIIVLNSTTGDAVSFKPDSSAKEFQQIFEVELCDDSFHDVNIVISSPNRYIGNLKATFCAPSTESHDYKEIVSSISGPLSHMLSHEDLLSVKFWTSCSESLAHDKILSRFFLLLSFHPSHTISLSDDINSTETTVSISAKVLPKSSSISDLPFGNDYRIRRSMTIQQTEKRPRSNQIRNFTLDQNDTAVLMFPFVAYDKAANISLIINEGDSPTSVEIFASICEEQKGQSIMTLSPVLGKYESVILKPGSLIPANLDCRFDIKRPTLQLTIQTIKNDTKLVELKDINTAKTRGTVAIRQQIVLNESTDNNNSKWSQELRIENNDSTKHQLSLEPTIVNLAVRTGHVVLALTPCAHLDNITAPISLENFSFGFHRVLLNYSLLEDLSRLAVNCPSTVQLVPLPAGDTTQQGLIFSPSEQPDTLESPAPYLWLLGSANKHSIAWIQLSPAADPGDDPIFPGPSTETSENEFFGWLLVIALMLVLIGLGTALIWMIQRCVAIHRGKRYDIQRRTVLQRANSTTPTRTPQSHQQQPLNAVSATVATTVDRNISAFEMGTRNWTISVGVMMQIQRIEFVEHAIQIEDVDADNPEDVGLGSNLGGGFHRTPSMEQLIPIDLDKYPEKSSDSRSVNNLAGHFIWLCTNVATFLGATKLFWIIVLYSIFGALLFIWLESPIDLAIKKEAFEYHVVARDTLLFKIKNIYIGNYLEKDQHLKTAIMEFEANAGFEVPPVTIQEIETSWTFWTAVLYAATIYTTVGVRYHLVTLNDRDSLARYISICKKLAKWRLIAGTISITVSEYSDEERGSIENGEDIAEKKSLREALTTGLLSEFSETNDNEPRNELKKQASHKKPSLQSNTSSSKSKSSTKTKASEDLPTGEYDGKRDAPVLTALFVTFGWMGLSAAVFCLWEEWSYFTSLYFFFISMSTIGFGDVTPKHPEYMVASFIVVVVGLSLVSVCINVVQEKFSQIYMGVLEKMLRQYMDAQKEGNEDAIKGFVKGFNDRTKYLMPFISKNQNLKIMNQFKEEAKAQGVELPPVLTELNPETGKPTFCQIFEGEAMERFLKNCSTSMEDISVQFDQSYGTRQTFTLTDQISTKTTGVQPEVSCILHVIGSDAEQYSSSEEFTSSEAENEESPRGVEQKIHERLTIIQSLPVGRATSLTEEPESLKAKRSLQMRRIPRVMSMESGESSPESRDEFSGARGRKYEIAAEVTRKGWEGETKEKQKKKKERKRKETVSGLRYMKNTATQVSSKNQNAGEQAGCPFTHLVDACDNTQTTLRNEFSVQTDIASSQDGSTQTVAHEQSNSSVQTDSPKFQNSAIQTLFDTVSIHSQTDVVLHEVGVQAKDADFYELGLAESEDTFETAHEEGYLQTRSVQTSKMHLVNRVVQTHLTSTFKHKHDFEGVTEAKKSKKSAKRRDDFKGEQSAKIAEAKHQMEELRQKFHLDDEEVEQLRSRMKEWRLGKLAERSKDMDVSVDQPKDAQEEIHIQEKIQAEEKEFLLQELKMLRAKKEKARRKSAKKLPATSRVEELEEEEVEETSTSTEEMSEEESLSISKRKTKRFKSQNTRMKLYEQPGGRIMRHGYEQSILDIELNRSPNAHASFIPHGLEGLTFATTSVFITMDQKVTEEDISLQDIDLDELLRKLSATQEFSFSERRSTITDEEEHLSEEEVEEFTADISTQTGDWIDVEVLNQIMESNLSAVILRNMISKYKMQTEYKNESVQTDNGMPLLLEEQQPISSPALTEQILPTKMPPVVIQKQSSVSHSEKESSLPVEETSKLSKFVHKFKGTKIGQLVSKFERLSTDIESEPAQPTQISTYDSSPASMHSPTSPATTLTAVSQKLLQSAAPAWIRRSSVPAQPEHVQHALRLPSELPITEEESTSSKESGTVPVIRRRGSIVPSPSQIMETIQEGPTELQAHLLQSGIVSQDALPSTIRRRRSSIAPPKVVVEKFGEKHERESKLEPVWINVSPAQLPVNLMALLEEDKFTQESLSQIFPSKIELKKEKIANTENLLYIPEKDVYIHPAAPQVILQRTDTGEFVPVSPTRVGANFEALFDIAAARITSGGGTTQQLSTRQVVESSVVLGQIIESASGEIQFLPGSSLDPNILEELEKSGYIVHGEVTSTADAIHFVPKTDYQAPEQSQNIAMRILPQINQLISSGIIPLPVDEPISGRRERRQSRVPELLQSRLQFLEQMARDEESQVAVFRDLPLKDTSHIPRRRPSVMGGIVEEAMKAQMLYVEQLEKQMQESIKWHRTQPLRQQRMLEFGVQAGVQSRVQYMLGTTEAPSSTSLAAEELPRAVTPPKYPTKKIILRRLQSGDLGFEIASDSEQPSTSRSTQERLQFSSGQSEPKRKSKDE